VFHFVAVDYAVIFVRTFLACAQKLWKELEEFGIIDDIHVMENVAAHIFGNVIVYFRSSTAALRCCKELNWFQSRRHPHWYKRRHPVPNTTTVPVSSIASSGTATASNSSIIPSIVFGATTTTDSNIERTMPISRLPELSSINANKLERVTCRFHKLNQCRHSEYCSFIHFKRVPPHVRRDCDDMAPYVSLHITISRSAKSSPTLSLTENVETQL